MFFNIWSLFALPLITALSGYLVPFVACWLIFHPRTAITIFGLRLQGLLPRRQHEIVQKTLDSLDRDLVRHTEIQDVLSNPQVSSAVAAAVDEQFDGYMKRLCDKNPIIGIFLQDDIVAEIREVMSEHMIATLPQIVVRVADKVGDQTTLQNVAREKIKAVDLTRFEKIVYEIARKDLKMTSIWGAGLGLVVGVLQVCALLFLN